MPARKKSKKTLGRTDRIDFPELGLMDVPCKVDTGAATSAIHCDRVKVIEKEDGDELSIRFGRPFIQGGKAKQVRIKNFTERKIISSNGMSEYRYVIKTKMVVHGLEFDAELTLADREKMRYPVLLGRKALRSRFVVDVSYAELSYKAKQKPIVNQ